ncbi:hypothetical protein [Hafnia paralvei]|uniref:hypothetical protein n=1 Tax=Hafnia paralvei TaxID=546367 RepID=UPI001034C507|nr:hypothetical protein [Hafnia paralvei]TBM28854.1 hypothetical protein EYY85_07430 [Hafnia paralvei]
MELFIFSKKLPFLQRVKLAEPLLHGVITILMGRNWSLKFSAASDNQLKGLVGEFHQVEVTADKAIICVADKQRSILNDE